MSTLAIILATLFVPQATDTQIANNPLANGEISYVNGSTGESFLYVGQAGEPATRVTDESALRGYEHADLDRNLFVVTPITNLTRDASTDTLTFTGFQTGVTNVWKFKFSIPNNVKFTDVEFKNKIDLPIANRECGNIEKIVAGNEVFVTMTDNEDDGLKLTVSDFRVIYRKYGDPNYVNELTKKIMWIDDTANYDTTLPKRAYVMPLGEWRRYLLHYYDGDRGHDWAYYNAKNNANVTSNEVHFGRGNIGLFQYAIGLDWNNTNAVTSRVFGRKAVSYYETEDTSGATGLSFTSVVVSNTTVVLNASLTNQTFDASLLRVYVSDRIEERLSNWREIPYTLASSNPISVIVEKKTLKSGFYRIAYGNSRIVVEVADTLKVDRLLLKGDNGSYYRIGVNSSGVLTATLEQ